MHRETVKFYVC